ncbi:MAG: type IV pilin protein [Methyloglobulus sp.]|nr:prepilin-type N-terminal cleavage/methylation domain-containing protein [Methyloglobulus sp.]
MFKNKGFTLIELMIAVAIIGILAAIAVPSYQESVRKSRRADVKGALLGLANAMERRFTETNSYLGAAGTDATPTDTGTPRPSIFKGATDYYNLTINPATQSSYTLTATPISGKSQATDKCGNFTLNEQGVKAYTGTTYGTKDQCW